jgi:hypothetical protein
MEIGTQTFETWKNEESKTLTRIHADQRGSFDIAANVEIKDPAQSQW